MFVANLRAVFGLTDLPIPLANVKIIPVFD
jgi:hypothetical protein